MRTQRLFAGATLALFWFASRSAAQVDPRLYAGLTWRNLGPFRGGRIAAVSGAIGQTGTFYAGLPAAGVWKTTSAGQTWYPVFDAVKDVSSIGAVEVAPSDPNVIYVGTGDMITGGGINEGNGVYKSTDAGKTWRHLGLDATKQIPSILVDPRDPNVVMIAAQGDVHVKSQVARRVPQHRRRRDVDADAVRRRHDRRRRSSRARTTSRTWSSRRRSRTTRRRLRRAPGRAARRWRARPGRPRRRVYKSTDGGVTWHEITGGGLPRAQRAHVGRRGA